MAKGSIPPPPPEESVFGASAVPPPPPEEQVFGSSDPLQSRLGQLGIQATSGMLEGASALVPQKLMDVIARGEHRMGITDSDDASLPAPNGKLEKAARLLGGGIGSAPAFVAGEGALDLGLSKAPAVESAAENIPAILRNALKHGTVAGGMTGAQMAAKTNGEALAHPIETGKAAAMSGGGAAALSALLGLPGAAMENVAGKVGGALDKEGPVMGPASFEDNGPSRVLQVPPARSAETPPFEPAHSGLPEGTKQLPKAKAIIDPDLRVLSKSSLAIPPAAKPPLTVPEEPARPLLPEPSTEGPQYHQPLAAPPLPPEPVQPAAQPGETPVKSERLQLPVADKVTAPPLLRQGPAALGPKPPEGVEIAQQELAQRMAAEADAAQKAAAQAAAALPPKDRSPFMEQAMKAYYKISPGETRRVLEPDFQMKGPSVEEATDNYIKASGGLRSGARSIEERSNKALLSEGDWYRAINRIHRLENGTLTDAQMTPQDALEGIQSINRFLKTAEGTKALSGGNGQALYGLKDRLYSFLENNGAPGMRQAAKDLRDAYVREHFSNWMPQNKYGTPDAARTLFSTWLGLKGVGKLALGDVPGAALDFAAPAMTSPRFAGKVVIPAYKAGQAASNAVGSAAGAIAGPVADGASQLLGFIRAQGGINPKLSKPFMQALSEAALPATISSASAKNSLTDMAAEAHRRGLIPDDSENSLLEMIKKARSERNPK